ncbi:sucrose-specific PTS transporter subunit IIBC [Enterococcus saccharolyticus]|uniref:protein-N(pi)-phosphohistidine--sucrose phosphotransferase n=1 Tax=Enterococcus saccharolyticus subsp. saccharolyticus ATCC 43076 TaxID=1139996 RepID=S0N4X5_9ENTE|nr:sucrose-specific PTS transporter subunit IIBC [Enterococcus saccharolyticus]EOT26364.1 PTS system, sucrose-specific IIBC component [Enterococcus saccharolyticus subsp. saccharolyticus ATCC 43076]EOT76324.1 PTS system, sucrose-specific IIBC component [Enterococcus saccharolyticus subsp. saccharolyticus ATCC 43076]OJG89830.1 PTS system, sucrose-specific IIBC component [Enterococcus saccharolyticus]
MDHKKVALEVIDAVGEDNLIAAAHCATRLRLVLRDTSKINQSALDNNDDVKGTFETNGQYQIIIGPGDVNKVYAEIVQATGVKEASTDDLKEIAASGKKPNPVMAMVKALSDIFVPLIPALVAGGLLMAINNVLTSQGLFGPQSVVEMFPAFNDFASIINLLASAPFAFLPVLVGYSATQRFGGNGYLGAAMAMAMVMPNLVNGYGVANAIAEGTMPYWNIFGLQVAQAGYQGSVLPVIAVSYILANLENFFHKRIPKVFDFTFTPMLAIIITGFLTFTIVGPVMRTVSDGLTDSLVWLYTTTGAVGLGLFGTFYSSIVITGLHQSFPAIETTLLADVARTGGSFIFPIAAMANIAQGAATFAVFFITKNEKQKSLASSAGISAMLGITEPAIFGVNLKLKYPFVCAMIASGIASVFIGLLHVLAVSMGPAGIIGFISIAAKSIPSFLICAVISFVVAFALTFVYGKKKMSEPEVAVATATTTTVTPEAPASTVASTSTVAVEKVSSPVKGQAVALSTVNDPVFSSEMMGKGIAVVPESDEVFAPVDGTLTVVYDTKHAYGIESDKGAEILIHIGIDTVNLAGEHFTTAKQSGDQVKKGDLLGTFDRAAIKKAGYDDTVMVIVTNTANYSDVAPLGKTGVAAGEEIFEIK